MTKEYEIRVEPRIAYDDKMLKDFVARENRLDVRTITAIQVIRRSIDARQKFVRVNMKIRVYIGEKPNKNLSVAIEYKYVGKGKNVIVVGEGPAGLFAALRLIELGYRPIIVERGKNVHERKKDIAKIKKMQMVDPESNYSFGEGGAGAYSDGKLYTRSKKRGSVEKILQVFCHHGASENILIDFKFQNSNFRFEILWRRIIGRLAMCAGAYGIGYAWGLHGICFRHRCGIRSTEWLE